MNGNQKMLLLLLVALALFFGVPWRWIIVLTALVLLVIFRGPIWSAISYAWQWAAAHLFSKKTTVSQAPTAPTKPQASDPTTFPPGVV